MSEPSCAPQTLGQALLEAAEHSDAGASFWVRADDSSRFTYRQLADGALKVSGALQAAGLRRAERVAIVLPTHPDFYRAFFGVILAGGVPVPLYPPVRLGRIDEWKAHTGAMLRAVSAAAVLTELRLVGLLGEPVRRSSIRLGCRTVDGLLEQDLPGSPCPGRPEDLAVVQFSSGSTGDPKPVALSHSNLLANVRAILDVFPGRLADHSGLTWLPLYHDMGLVGNMLVAVLGQGDITLIAPERFVVRPRIWLEAMTATRATLSAAPNFAYGLCADRIGDDELEGLDLSHWRLAFCGAEPIQPATLDAFARRFAPAGFRRRALMPVYGLAEATLAVTFPDPDEEPRWGRFDVERLADHGEAVPVDGEHGGRGQPLCSLGRPLPGVELAIRDGAGDDLPDDRVGHLWVRGPGVMTGYLDRPAATDAVIRDGWLDTGDLGFVQRDELYLCGRRKDLIIIRGRNVDPAFVEQAIDGLDGLRTGCAAAIGVSDPRTHTERLVLLAEVRGAAAEVEAADLLRSAAAAVRRGTGLDPDEIVLLGPGTLPRTSSGKIRRAEARRRWLENCLSAPSGGGRQTLVKETVLGLYSHLRAWSG